MSTDKFNFYILINTFWGNIGIEYVDTFEKVIMCA